MGRVIAKTVHDVACRQAIGGCGHLFDAVVTEREGWKCSCPKCGCECDTQPPPKPRVFSIGNKPWGKEGRSLSYAFDPKAIKSIGASCPTLAKAIDPNDGTVVFENDTHQKAVYGEMAREKKVIAEKRDTEVAANEAAFFGEGKKSNKASAVAAPAE